MAVVEIKRREGFAADVFGRQDLAIFYEAPIKGIFFKEHMDGVPLAGKKIEIDIPREYIGKGSHQKAALPLSGNGLRKGAFNGKSFGNGFLFQWDFPAIGLKRIVIGPDGHILIGQAGFIN